MPKKPARRQEKIADFFSTGARLKTVGNQPQKIHKKQNDFMSFKMEARNTRKSMHIFVVLCFLRLIFNRFQPRPFRGPGGARH